MSVQKLRDLTVDSLVPFFTPFFLTMEGVILSKEWEIGRKLFVLCLFVFFIVKIQQKVDIFSLDKLFVPIHLGNHWTLGVVNFKKRRLEYYDSMGGRNTQCIKVYLVIFIV